jgi:predicted permease
MDVNQLIDLVGTIIYGIAFMFVIGGICYLLVTRGLWRRQRWAFYVAIVFSVIGGLSSLASILLAIATRDIAISTIISIVLQIVMIALTVVSYQDFFGPKVRLQPKVESTHAAAHYKNGLVYKQRGMWYMVIKEWEAALNQAPTNVQYLHALGLAYAQIKQFNQSRATLDQALHLAPADGHLKDSRALVERMANAA